MRFAATMKALLGARFQPPPERSISACCLRRGWGNTLAREVLDHCIGVWSSLTVSLIHAYDPQVLVFGGGVMHRQEAILPKIREHVGRHAWQKRIQLR